MSAVLVHTLVVIAALAAYTVLTVTGNDGNPVFAFLGGQAAGGFVQAKTSATG